MRFRTLLEETNRKYLTFTPVTATQFKFTGTTPSGGTINQLQYSMNGGSTWTTLANDTYTPSVPTGNSIMFKGVCVPANASGTGIGTFASTGGTFSASGNIMSLLFGDNIEGKFDLTGYNSAFGILFNGCTGLVSIDDLLLPATTLASYCYYQMFQNCTGLTSLPSNLLPATTLANYCYRQMFQNCTGLTSLPSNLLPATTLVYYCYQSMFNGCTGLTSLPSNLLPATTLAYYCYGFMFQKCTGLTTLPSGLLPATNLTDGVYCYGGMFADCRGLTSLPSNLLPATTLAESCYISMFQNCTGLTSLPSNLLPATTLAYYCYQSMFSGCTGLTTLPSGLLPATNLTNIDYCYESMFSGCTGLTSLPSNLLPATTLADSCYRQMFYGCTNLTTAPDLPATTLVSNCYYQMFYNCSSLSYIKALFTTTPSTYYTGNWVSGVAASGTFVKNSAATWTTTGVHAVPSGWTTVNQIQYLQSTGTQYIDLGVYGTHTHGIEMKFQYPSLTTTSGSGRIFGTKTSSSTTGAFGYVNTTTGTTSSSAKLYLCSNGGLSNTIAIDTSTHVVKMNVDNDKKVYLDTTLAVTGNANTFTNTAQASLFRCNSAGTWYTGGRARVYYLKIYNEGSLIMDLIPVKNGTTGYMCDRLTGTRYGNNGTGSFTLGPVVNS